MNNGINSLPVISKVEDFGTVIENILDQAKKNLGFNYDLEMDNLEDILEDNDRVLDDLERDLSSLHFG